MTGGCHCGAVRFRVTPRPGEPLRAVVCNCSICEKKGFVHWIVEKDQFELLSGADRLVEYRFNTGTARHLFCGTCGIHAFYVPRSHPDGFDVNVRCLDDDAASRFEISTFDGRNWEDNVGSLK